MLYEIEYSGAKCYNYASSRKDLLEWIRLLNNENITDIRKVYKTGVTDSVLEKYQDYIEKTKSKGK